MPQRVRELLGSQKLPHWVCEIFGLEHPAMFGELPGSIELNSHGDLKAIQHFFTTSLSRRMKTADLKEALVLPFCDMELTTDDIEGLGFSVRTSNCLCAYIRESGGPLDTSSLTFGDLSSIPNMGALSVFEFLNAFDMVVANGDEEIGEVARHQVLSQEESQSLIEELITKLEGDGKLQELIVGDARFPVLIRPFPKVQAVVGETFDLVLQRLAQEISAYSPIMMSNAADTLCEVQKGADQTADMPLDRQMKQLIAAHYKRAKPHNLEAMYHRFGINDFGCYTLEEAGAVAGVTRERIRQIESKILKSIVKTEASFFMPGLDAAIDFLNDCVGMSEEDIPSMLIQNGISSEPVSFGAVELFAGITNRESLRVCSERLQDGQRIIGSAGYDFKRLHVLLRKLSSKNGVADLRLAVDDLCGEGSVEEYLATAKTFLVNAGLFAPLDDNRDWWTPSDPATLSRNRIVNLARKIMSVSNPLSVEDLRESFLKLGVYRNSSHTSYSGDKGIVVPSRAAILSFFEYLPGYSVSDNLISCDEKLDYRFELGETERVIVDIIRGTPSGVVNRNFMLKEGSRRGLNESTITVYMTYSPLVQHIASETYKLVGKDIDPGALSAHQSAVASKVREKRVLLGDWHEGRIRICVRCPEFINSMVIGAPPSIKAFIRSKSFDAVDHRGMPCGTLSSDEDGAIWGTGVFCRKYGLEHNDILGMEFDISASLVHMAQISLEDILDDIE